MYDYSPESCLIKDIDGQLYNIIDLWKGIKQPVDPSTIQRSYAPRTCLVENIDGTTVNVIDAILSIANGSGAGTSCLQEVIQARNEYKTLDERLDTENKKIYDTLNAKDYLHFKGEYITVPHSKIGYTKGLKIQGKTYQNIFPSTHEGKIQLSNATFDNSTGTITLSPRKNIYCQAWEQDLPFYKPNTTYTTVIDILENTLVKTEGVLDNQCILIAGQRTGTDNVLGVKGFNITVSNGATGRYIHKIETVDNIPEHNNGIRLFLNNAFDSGQLKYKIMILEGDYTNSYIPPYFQGIKSVAEGDASEIKYQSVGKNLVKYLEVGGTYGVVGDKFGSDYTSNSYLRSNYIDVTNIKQLSAHLTGNSNVKMNVWIFYDKNKKGIYPYDRGTTVNVPSKAKYCRVELSHSSQEGGVIDQYLKDMKLTVVEGNTLPQEYIPYQEDKINILLPYENGLKSYPDGTCDEIINNKVIQRIEKIVFDGSEDEPWSFNVDETQGNYIAAKISNSGIDTVVNNVLPNSVVDGFTDKNIYTLSDTIVIINRDKNSLEEYKAWLQANPIEVYYKLVKPIEHQLPLDNYELKTYADTTHIFSTNTISPVIDCQAPSNPQAVVADLMVANENLNNELNTKTRELQAKDQSLANEDDLLTAKDLDMDFRIFELEEQLTPQIAKLSMSHNSPYPMIKRCIEKGLYEKEDMLYKMNRYLHGKRLTQEEYDELKLMMG